MSYFITEKEENLYLYGTNKPDKLEKDPDGSVKIR